MSLQRFPQRNRKAEADRSSLGKDRTPNYTSNVTMAPTHDLPGRDSEYSLTDTPGIAESSQGATLNYSERSSGKFKFSSLLICVLLVYYRIYAKDGATYTKKPVPGDPFLGHIKAISVPPPHTAKNVKRSIAKVECIEDPTNCILFLTPYSQSPTDDADKIAVLNRSTGPGSTPHEPLALVAKMSDSERSALKYERRGGLASAAEADSMTPEIRYRTSI